MFQDAYQVLQERGFLQQVTDPESVQGLLRKGPVTFYVGFDATASSLHAGSLVPIMAMAHLQRAGHRPIALLGTGTTLIGDPSGKTQARPLLAREQIAANKEGIRRNLECFLELGEPGRPGSEKGLLLENGAWLEPLCYLDFLREIGRHFSVNRMLAAEAYKARLETGLSFLEFNYQILQAYDFLVLHREHGCVLQAGGDDQWGNMVAGTDLIRRVAGPQAVAEAFTFPLLTTATGAKMGKSERGAIWLDSGRLSPYDYYQYWINSDDRDLERFLKLFTFLDLAEIATLISEHGPGIREAKATLAFEATANLHGKDQATRAAEMARALFGGQAGSAEAPTVATAQAAPEVDWGGPVPVTRLFTASGLCATASEARRLIQQGGAWIGERRLEDPSGSWDLGREDPEAGLLLRAGKKKYCRLIRGARPDGTGPL